MAGAEKLIEKIGADAQRDAEKYWHEAELKKDDMRSALMRQIDTIKADMENAAQETAKENKRRLTAVYDLEYRKQLLAAKQDMMAQAKALALQKICALSDADYAALMKKRLIECAKTGSGHIAVSKDETRLDASFLADVNRELEQTHGSGRIALSSEHRDMRGGFVFIEGGMEINMSLEAQLDAAWKDSETQMAEILFESNNG